MQRLRNQVTIVGNMNQSASITRFENGSLVARFSMATENKVSGKQKTKQAELFRMFAWGNTAQFIQRYCGVGNRLAITGKLVNRTYVSPEGQPRKITEVEVRQVVRL